MFSYYELRHILANCAKCVLNQESSKTYSRIFNLIVAIGLY